MSGQLLRRTAAPATAGLVLFLLACLLPGVGLYTGRQPADVALYQEFGEKLLDGQIPYRDYSVEYPPGALPAFVGPALGPGQHYTLLFKLLMILCGLAAVAGVTLTLVAAGAAPLHTWAGTAFAAVAPLALGETFLNRYDLWPAALVSVALALLVAGGRRLPLALLGLAAAAKLYPLALVPLALLWLWRRAGRDAVRSGALWFTGAAAVVVLPFLALGPGGLRFTTLQLVRRPLQIESLGGSLVAAAHRLGLADASVTTEYGSQNPHGALSGPVLLLTTALLVATVAAVWVLAARRELGPAELLLAAAAVVTAFVAFGKVLSPQYLVWLVPLVPLVRGRTGVAAGGLLLGALLLTRAWFPNRYDEVATLRTETWLVVARNGLLVALALLLLAALVREIGTNPSQRRAGLRGSRAASRLWDAPEA